VEPVDPNGELARTIRSLPRVQLQNRLMRLGAREIAVALRLLADADQDLALRALPLLNAVRVCEEMDLQRRRRLSSRDLIGQVIAHRSTNRLDPYPPRRPGSLFA
jgi:hypothetical protein